MELIDGIDRLDRFDRLVGSMESIDRSIGILDVIDTINRIIRSMDVPIDRIIRSIDVPIDAIIRPIDAPIDAIIPSIHAPMDTFHRYGSKVRTFATPNPSTDRPPRRPRRRRTIQFRRCMRSSRLRRSAHADASRRPRARFRSTESIERIFSRRLCAAMLAAALRPALTARDSSESSRIATHSFEIRRRRAGETGDERGFVQG